MLRHLLIILTIAGGAGCATTDTVRPAAPAAQLPGHSPAAVATVEGVRLEVRTDMEHQRPLDRPLTHLFVKIRNESAWDLRVQPLAFHLVTPSGARYQAIPPDRLRRTGESPVPADIAIAIEALPQDVLSKGGQTEGFLYFQELDTAGPLTLTFELRKQADNATFGLITVPLETPTRRAAAVDAAFVLRGA